LNPLSGILLVDKPPGPTSHQVVGRVRKVTGTRRVGHAGTLDPFASGLLLVLLGPSTRLSEYLLGLDKEYRVEMRLGVETTTHDPEGEIVSESPDWAGVTTAALEAAVGELQGPILQRPPRFSAKKVKGESAHRRARRGEEVELTPVEVTVYRMEVEEVQLPVVRMWLRCSSGTYVRALARDLGRTLGVGAHLTGLRRTSVGSFTVDQALHPDELEDSGTLENHLVSPSRALAHLPMYEVRLQEADRLRRGQFLPIGDQAGGTELPEGLPVRVLQNGELVAVAYRAGERLRPRKVFPHA
jgi:tRNA pseudouridine55 synthase